MDRGSLASKNDLLDDKWDRTMSYDGHGRLKTQHRPEQDAGAVTTYNYYADDKVQQIVDARGATTDFVYNALGLVQQKSYTSPNVSLIPVTPTVTYSYDSLGNRTGMTDGIGTKTYEYDELSRMTAETRNFTENMPNAPSSNNGFRLEYTYTMGGALKSLRDPWGEVINYSYDKIGRTDAVTGSTYGGMATYASSPVHDARGMLTHLTYGNGVELDTSGFDSRLRPSHFEVKKGATDLIKKNYTYYADSKLQYTQDLLDSKFDRLNRFDHVGRLNQAKTSYEARGSAPSNDYSFNRLNLPYRQTYQFDVYGNLTQRNNLHWGLNQHPTSGITFEMSDTYVNNRRTDDQYNPDGMTVFENRDESGTPGYYLGYSQYKYDAAGQIVKVNTGDIVGEDENHNVVWQFGESTNLYDGDGEFHSRSVVTGVIPTDLIFGGIRSTVLGGQAVSYYRGGGEKYKTFVYSGGVTIACQFNAVTGPTTNDREERVYFSHADLSGKSTLWTRSNGEKVVEATGLEYENDVNFVPAELDGAGNIVGFSDPYLQPEPTPLEAPEYVGYMPFANPGERTTYNPQEPQVILDGISMSYSYWRERFQYRRFELNSYSLSRAGTPIYSWRNVSKTRDSKNGYVGDGDIIRVNTEIENYVIGWNMAFSWLGGVNLGKSLPINEKASSALNDFLKQNPGCAEVAKELGLVALNGSVTHIDVNNDEDLLNTKLKDLGWHDDPTTTQFINNQHKERTLRQELSESEGGIAVSNLGTNTVYYGTQNPTSAPSFGFVVFHELLHISVKGGHFDIAEKLGIFSGKVTEYPNGMRGIPGNADEMAAVDLFEFMKKGCKKKETEAKKP